MYSNQLVVVFAVFLTVLAPMSADAKPNPHRNDRSAKIVKVLPSAHHRISHRGQSYFFSSGRFYRHGNGGYVAIAAPIGAVVPALPRGYLSFGIGINRYFYFSGIYYRHTDSGYEVIKEPEEAEVLATEGSDKLIIYPAAGQTDELRDEDRYHCHVWASEETQFDPTDANSDPVLRADYRRALSACMEAKNYIVK